MRLVRESRDRGAGAAEYAGLIVLAALILGVMVPAFTPSIKDNVEYQLCKIFAGGDASKCESPQDKTYKPSSCTTGISTNTYGGSVDIAIFTIGKDLTFMRTTTVDNNGNKTVTLTAVNNESLGVGTGVGVGVNAGGLNLGADASVGANLKVGIGDSWQFTGKDAESDADNFVGDMREQATIDSVKSTGPLGWVAGEVYDHTAGPDIRDPDLTRTEFSLNGDASVSAGLGVGPGKPKGKHAKGRAEEGDKDKRGDTGVSPNMSAGLKIDGSEKGIIETNKKTGEQSVSFILSGTGTASENHVTGSNQAKKGYQGMVKVTKDKDGNITGLDLTRVETSGGTAEWTTTHLPIDNSQDRQAVSDYLLRGGGTGLGQTTLNLNWEDLAPTEPPGPNASPLQQLLYEKGQTTKADYSYDSSDNNYGANVKLGLKLGLNVGISSTDQKLKNAQYLGAPGADGKRQYVDYKECHA